jgi:hypothetical protein
LAVFGEALLQDCSAFQEDDDHADAFGFAGQWDFIAELSESGEPFFDLLALEFLDDLLLDHQILPH